MNILLMKDIGLLLWEMLTADWLSLFWCCLYLCYLELNLIFENKIYSTLNHSSTMYPFISLLFVHFIPLANSCGVWDMNASFEFSNSCKTFLGGYRQGCHPFKSCCRGLQCDYLHSRWLKNSVLLSFSEIF